MPHLKNLHFVLVCGELPQYVLQNLRWIMQKVCTHGKDTGGLEVLTQVA